MFEVLVAVFSFLARADAAVVAGATTDHAYKCPVLGSLHDEGLVLKGMLCDLPRGSLVRSSIITSMSYRIEDRTDEVYKVMFGGRPCPTQSYDSAELGMFYRAKLIST